MSDVGTPMTMLTKPEADATIIAINNRLRDLERVIAAYANESWARSLVMNWIEQRDVLQSALPKIARKRIGK